MLGRFSKGMVVKIPAAFQDSQQRPVEMDNVNVKIQFFDNDHREFKHMLPETAMKYIGPGRYLHEFTVPPHAKNGNYIVHIQAKHPGSISNVSEATDTFEVIDNTTAIENRVPVQEAVEESTDSQPEKPAFDINTFKIDKVKSINQNSKLDVEDVVVDIFNNPVKGVHVNVFEKAGFMPKSPNNVKVGSSVTDDTGAWKIRLSPGEYVFTYKGLGMKENREFRKV